MKIYFYTLFLAILVSILQPVKSDAVLGKQIFSQKAYPGGFSVHIVANKSLPIRAAEEFTLEANIVMENGVGSFEFQWLLPEGVQVVSGVIDPSLTFGPNGSAQTKITLVIFEDQYNYQIIGEAYRMNAQGVKGAVGQFNTNPNLLGPKSRLPDHKKYKLLQ